MADDVIEFRIDTGRYYSLDHIWFLKIEDRYTIGISDFLQAELGEILRIDMPNSSQNETDTDAHWKVETGDDLIAIISSKDKITFAAPFSADVVEVNGEVVNNPEIVNDDPYGDGWLMILKPHDGPPEEGLLESDEYMDALDELFED